ncbi:hypothetical protein D9756_011089 [Leucocoprinus leucothites]|uniref:Nephrocystin 3-like N-terminal domain-containing protein n=1 Tax=Leucocoprinus leucothites TaxID=201217 RepID=A0A8H5CP50_9AGAR|nr:hypothetical protein D9756_011089 [Leucoagaricus leucothites]
MDQKQDDAQSLLGEHSEPDAQMTPQKSHIEASDNEEEHQEDTRFNPAPPSPWKRLGLIILVCLLFYFGFTMRTTLLKTNKPEVIYASRYSKEHKFRPAASPVITETLKDGRTRIRGAYPTPTTTAISTSTAVKKRRRSTQAGRASGGKSKRKKSSPAVAKHKGVKVKGGTFNENTLHVHHHSFSDPGFDKLQAASLPQAMHDSSARDPPRCFPGTREEHLRAITSWGKGEWKGSRTRVLWMKGPAGVGKSAIAQTWVEGLEGKHSASFFFSRANHWNNPNKFIPTIAYQLATKYPSYRESVCATIVRDPFVLQKSINTQFRELLVEPLRELSPEDRDASDKAVVVIDGLDECDGLEAQDAIVQVIITSVAEGTSPFLWAFFTRPEPNIVTSFSSGEAKELCWYLTLPVSRDADKDIEAYLRDGFRTIRVKNSIPEDLPWPLEEDILQLVEQSAGLFVYGASAMRFITLGPGLPGPAERLKSLLDLENNASQPLSKLDQLYLLIMQQIPKDILQNTLLILTCSQMITFHRMAVSYTCILLNFAEVTFYPLLHNLHSVLEVESHSKYANRYLRFYHASFTDFLDAPERSTPEYCIRTHYLYSRLYSACLDLACAPLPLCSPGLTTEPCSVSCFGSDKKKMMTYIIAMDELIRLPRVMLPLYQLRTDPGSLDRLLLAKWGHAVTGFTMAPIRMDDIETFIKEVPEKWRSSVITRAPARETLLSKVKALVLQRASPGVYTLGAGIHKVLLVKDEKYE